MTKDEIKHINWMYNRLTSVHKENPNLDYMIKFKEIIDQQLILSGVSKSLNATYKKGDNVILDTGLKAEILGFKNNLAIVLDERGLKFYKQLHKIKHQ
tara:strand:+ start:356 stop:649 length:294 start_codon:yes stop_codon:yes gene_type:complete